MLLKEGNISRICVNMCCYLIPQSLYVPNGIKGVVASLVKR